MGYKLAILADTHFGIRADSNIMLDYQQKFFDNVFFPYLRDHNINHIIHLGDLVDRRKYINFNTAKRMREMFLSKITGSLVCDVIAGNHDVTFKNTNDLNALQELVSDRYQSIIIHDTPKEIVIHNRLTSEPICEALVLPWITDDNREQTFELMNKTKAQIVFAHLELKGFLTNDGSIANHGDDPKLWQKFDTVLTGHYHTRITKDNIYYVGCPYQMTWDDYNNEKGFYVFDVETREIEFIKNPHQMFVKINYNDALHTLDKMKKDVSKANITDAFVKLVVEEKLEPYKFEQFLNHVESKYPCDLKIIETKELAIDADIDHTEDTLSILKKSVNSLDVAVDKNSLERLIVNTYNRAIAVEI